MFMVADFYTSGNDPFKLSTFSDLCGVTLETGLHRTTQPIAESSTHLKAFYMILTFSLWLHMHCTLNWLLMCPEGEPKSEA